MGALGKRKWIRDLLFVFILILVVSALSWFGFTHFIHNVPVSDSASVGGINTLLPAESSGLSVDKMEAYLKTEKDSMDKKQEQLQDTNYLKLRQPVEPESVQTSFYAEKKYKVPQQLHPLPRTENFPAMESISEVQTLGFSTDSLQVKQTNKEIIAPDPVLQQLETMIDKLNLLQKPSSNLPEKTLPGEIQIVERPITKQPISSPVKAMVHGEQIITEGAMIKLRLLEDLLFGKVLIPRNSFIFGECSLTRDRMLIEIFQVAVNGQYMPVQLTVMDIDGNKGIYVPGSLTAEIAKVSGERAMQNLSLNQVSRGIGNHLLNTGIESTCSLLTGKLRQQRLTIKAGHQVFIQAIE